MAVVQVNLTADLIVAVLGCLFCVAMAVRCQRVKGVYPWSMHPAIWGVLGFLFSVIAMILSVIARATTKPRPASSPGYYGGYPSAGVPQGQWQPPPPSSGLPGAFPTYPATGAAPPPVGYPPAPPVATSPPPAWQPDPLGRHELRYWDGTQWSEHVSDAGTQTTDPL